MSQTYKRNEFPYDMEYKNGSETPLIWCFTFDEEEHSYLIDLAVKLFSIIPSQVGCESNFSTL
jgi:hypothetical protein